VHLINVATDQTKADVVVLGEERAKFDSRLTEEAARLDHRVTEEVAKLDRRTTERRQPGSTATWRGFGRRSRTCGRTCSGGPVFWVGQIGALLGILFASFHR
jgi:hypothetical protein